MLGTLHSTRAMCTHLPARQATLHDPHMGGVDLTSVHMTVSTLYTCATGTRTTHKIPQTG